MIWKRPRGSSGAVLETSLFYLALVSAMLWAFGIEKESGYPNYLIQIESHATDTATWWASDWQILPAMRSAYGALESQQLNSQLSGEIDAVRQVLVNNDWRATREAGWSWPLQSLNPRADLSNLPIPARNFLGQPELLHMHSSAGNQELVETFQLWDSGWLMTDNEKPLYVGQLMNEELSRRLGFFSYWRGSAVTDEQLTRFADMLTNAGFEVELREGWLLVRR